MLANSPVHPVLLAKDLVVAPVVRMTGTQHGGRAPVVIAAVIRAVVRTAVAVRPAETGPRYR